MTLRVISDGVTSNTIERRFLNVQPTSFSLGIFPPGIIARCVDPLLITVMRVCGSYLHRLGKSSAMWEMVRLAVLHNWEEAIPISRS
jgi:hypothetical protein